MKQSEKQNTYRKILMSAIEEFSEKSYDNASLNAICEKYNISKESYIITLKIKTNCICAQ